MQFDLDQRLHLLSAFDRVGRARYLKNWKGTEAWAKPAPNAAVATRDDKEALKADLQRLVNKIGVRRDLSNEAETQAEKDSYSEQLADLYRERDVLNKRIQELPDMTDGQIEDAEISARRSSVERELRAAFAQNDLLLYHGFDAVAQWKDYCATGDFEIRFDLSQVVVPERYSNFRVQPAFVDRIAFEAWLHERYKATLLDQDRLPNETRLAYWLRDQFNQDSQQHLAKEDLRNLAANELNITNVRLFDRVWGNVAPASRKSSGRKRKG